MTAIKKKITQPETKMSLEGSITSQNLRSARLNFNERFAEEV